MCRAEFDGFDGQLGGVWFGCMYDMMRWLLYRIPAFLSNAI